MIKEHGLLLPMLRQDGLKVKTYPTVVLFLFMGLIMSIMAQEISKFSNIVVLQLFDQFGAQCRSIGSLRVNGLFVSVYITTLCGFRLMFHMIFFCLFFKLFSLYNLIVS